MFPAGGEVAVAAEEGAGLLRRHHRLLTSAVGAVRVGALRGEEAPLPCEDEEGADKSYVKKIIHFNHCLVEFLEVRMRYVINTNRLSKVLTRKRPPFFSEPPSGGLDL